MKRARQINNNHHHNNDAIVLSPNGSPSKDSHAIINGMHRHENTSGLQAQITELQHIIKQQGATVFELQRDSATRAQLDAAVAFKVNQHRVEALLQKNNEKWAGKIDELEMLVKEQVASIKPSVAEARKADLESLKPLVRSLMRIELDARLDFQVKCSIDELEHKMMNHFEAVIDLDPEYRADMQTVAKLGHRVKTLQDTIKVLADEIRSSHDDRVEEQFENACAKSALLVQQCKEEVKDIIDEASDMVQENKENIREAAMIAREAMKEESLKVRKNLKEVGSMRLQEYEERMDEKYRLDIGNAMQQIGVCIAESQESIRTAKTAGKAVYNMEDTLKQGQTNVAAMQRVTIKLNTDMQKYGTIASNLSRTQKQAQKGLMDHAIQLDKIRHKLEALDNFDFSKMQQVEITATETVARLKQLETQTLGEINRRISTMQNDLLKGLSKSEKTNELAVREMGTTLKEHVHGVSGDVTALVEQTRTRLAHEHKEALKSQVAKNNGQMTLLQRRVRELEKQNERGSGQEDVKATLINRIKERDSKVNKKISIFEKKLNLLVGKAGTNNTDFDDDNDDNNSVSSGGTNTRQRGWKSSIVSGSSSVDKSNKRHTLQQSSKQSINKPNKFVSLERAKINESGGDVGDGGNNDEYSGPYEENDPRTVEHFTLAEHTNELTPVLAHLQTRIVNIEALLESQGLNDKPSHDINDLVLGVESSEYRVGKSGRRASDGGTTISSSLSDQVQQSADVLQLLKNLSKEMEIKLTYFETMRDDVALKLRQMAKDKLRPRTSLESNNISSSSNTMQSNGIVLSRLAFLVEKQVNERAVDQEKKFVQTLTQYLNNAFASLGNRIEASAIPQFNSDISTVDLSQPNSELTTAQQSVDLSGDTVQQEIDVNAKLEPQQKQQQQQQQQQQHHHYHRQQLHFNTSQIHKDQQNNVQQEDLLVAVGVGASLSPRQRASMSASGVSSNAGSRGILGNIDASGESSQQALRPRTTSQILSSSFSTMLANETMNKNSPQQKQQHQVEQSGDTPTPRSQTLDNQLVGLQFAAAFECEVEQASHSARGFSSSPTRSCSSVGLDESNININNTNTNANTKRKQSWTNDSIFVDAPADVLDVVEPVMVRVIQMRYMLEALHERLDVEIGTLNTQLTRIPDFESLHHRLLAMEESIHRFDVIEDALGPLSNMQADIINLRAENLAMTEEFDRRGLAFDKTAVVVPSETVKFNGFVGQMAGKTKSKGKGASVGKDNSVSLDDIPMTRRVDHSQLEQDIRELRLGLGLGNTSTGAVNPASKPRKARHTMKPTINDMMPSSDSSAQSLHK